MKSFSAAESTLTRFVPAPSPTQCLLASDQVKARAKYLNREPPHSSQPSKSVSCAAVGSSVGSADGLAVGAAGSVGFADGSAAGLAVGAGGGAGVGPGDGDGVGDGVGCSVGSREGAGVGCLVGSREGAGVRRLDVGSRVGCNVGGAVHGQNRVPSVLKGAWPQLLAEPTPYRHAVVLQDGGRQISGVCLVVVLSLHELVYPASTMTVYKVVRQQCSSVSVKL